VHVQEKEKRLFQPPTHKLKKKRSNKQTKLLANWEADPPPVWPCLLFFLGGEPSCQKAADIVAFERVPLDHGQQKVTAKAKPGRAGICLCNSLLGHDPIPLSYY
jgi:hypothetical protein